MIQHIAKRVRLVLSSSRGDLLSQSVVSAVAVSVMTIGLVSLFMVMLTASQVVATNATRSSYLSSELAASGPQAPHMVGAGAVPVQIDDVEVPGGHTTVWKWAEKVSDWEVHLKAAMPKSARYGDRTAQCLTPTGSIDAAGGPTYDVVEECLLEVSSVPLDLGGVGANAVAAPGVPGTSIMHTAIAAGVTELRYTLLVESVTGADPHIIIRSDNHEGSGPAEHTIQVDGPGYYYGGLDVTGVHDLHVVEAGVDIDADRSLIYEAPSDD